MKAIVIFTAALMTGASIYGVTSYKQLSGTKGFKDLYVEKKQPPKEEPVTTEIAGEKKEAALTKNKKPDNFSTVSKAKRKPVAPKKEESKAGLITTEELSAKEPAVQEFLTEQAAAEVKEDATSITKEQPKKVKKLKRRMFSRAALRDE